MGVVATVVGIIGAIGVLSGVVVLAREVRALAGGEDGVPPIEVGARGTVGVALVVAGATLAYVALVLGGVLSPW